MSDWMHWPVLPLLIPLIAGAATLLLPEGLRRATSILATLALIWAGVILYAEVIGRGPLVYALGGWSPPFGIALVADRLSAGLVVLTGVLALVALLHAIAQDEDQRGPNFHTFFQFQLLGIAGAFLTGDMFNLFVFFEILLIASYCLLLHGRGAARIGAALHVVVLNLIGSGLFLVALGLLYGTLGTLNMADLAQRVATVPDSSAWLVAAGGLLLLVVFGLKAALFPLYFWLPSAYAAASASVACLFAILTKVGVYSIIRVYTLVFGTGAGALANLAEPWLLPVALGTMVLATLGVMSSSSLREQLGYMVVLSVGTTLASVGLFTPAGTAAAIYYLLKSTLAAGGLYLLADHIRRQRGDIGDRFEVAAPMRQRALLGGLFFAGVVVMTGLPPASGFVGKLMVLHAAADSPAMPWIWALVLGTSLASVVTLARSGSTLFWRSLPADEEVTKGVDRPKAAALSLSVATITIASGFALAVFAEAFVEQASAIAQEVHARDGYIEAVLGRDEQMPTEGSP